MCGIAGSLAGPTSGPVALEELRRMVAMLRHRGPDGYGLYRDERVGLAHSRLSIIDLSGGAQPMANEDQQVWVTFNGEIFNYPELRQELEGFGHRFRTNCDTEIIVHAFEQYGEEAWKRFNGQFAFGLWDRRAHRLWLVRDHLGILPLFYCRAKGRIWFASEAKAIFAGGGVTPEFESGSLNQVFTRWSAMAPATVFQNIACVPPGSTICFDEELRETRRTWWQPVLEEDPQYASLSLEEAAEGLEERLTAAVRLRLRADVPVGAYLSGGLDSSVIGELIRRVDSSPLQTFAVRFADPQFDETVQQRRMAGLLGTQHHEVMCGASEIADILPDVIWHAETPLLRTAPAPLFLLSELVTRNGMKVVLTGEGADELLAGYDVFKEDRVRRFWARQPESPWRPELLSTLYRDVGSGSQRQNRMWQRFFARQLAQVDHPFYSHLIRWQNTMWATGFLAPHVRIAFDPGQMEQELEQSLPAGWRNWRPLARAQLIEMATFLSPYLLCCQGDRVAMGHGVEVRYPFLDPEVVDYCNRLPGRFKLRGLQQDKQALRKLASRRLPADIWGRPKKPYRAPMTTVLFGAKPPDYVDELLSPRSLAQYGLVDGPAAEQLVAKARRQSGRMAGEREEMALVGLLTLQLLAHHYQDGFAARAAEARRRLDDHPLCMMEDRCGAAASQRVSEAASEQVSEADVVEARAPVG